MKNIRTGTVHSVLGRYGIQHSEVYSHSKFFSSSPAGHLPCVLFQDVSGKSLNLTAANSNERTEEALPWPERLK